MQQLAAQFTSRACTIHRTMPAVPPNLRGEIEALRAYLLRYASLQLRNPEQALTDKQFLRALDKCLAMLPARTSRVFLMREHLGFETADICKELGITATHCWVLLYRARMALRECLEKGWLRR